MNSIRENFDRLLLERQLTPEFEFLEAARMSATELQHAVQSQRIFHIEADGMRAYPSFFLDPTLDRKVLEEITALLGNITDGGKFSFFTTARGSLAKPGKVVNGVLTQDGSPRTPLQALRDGELSEVKRIAAAYAHR